uniref:NR LBD domain-containing protein n=1 Tax=Panagrellus redivivus TaxID=6233 RepID=A0A7E4VWR6_PANRE
MIRIIFGYIIAYIYALWARIFVPPQVIAVGVDLELGYVEPQGPGEVIEDDEQIPPEVEIVPEIAPIPSVDKDPEDDFDTPEETRAGDIQRFMAFRFGNQKLHFKPADIENAVNCIKGLLEVAFHTMKSGRCDENELNERGIEELNKLRSDVAQNLAPFEEALCLHLWHHTLNLSIAFPQIHGQYEDLTELVNCLEDWVNIFKSAEFHKINPYHLHEYGTQVIMFHRIRHLYP